ncbi:hypothetical protein SAY86_011297 [Trapa natans]|uniref:Uncharacterized protein n=1 Tax=Trapa natans TaxID=22666 RepID=A0AAN7LLX0_TRANT|nr:hypothetical protein SAY86_011297 [Trapa natans]
MGCCESTHSRASASPSLLPTTDRITGASVMVAEEKVKEVLCETPAAPRPVTRPPVDLKPLETLQNDGSPPDKLVGQTKQPPQSPAAAYEKSATEPEDVRGLNERASTTTATNTTGDGETQPRAERSPVKPRPLRPRSFSGELSASAARGSGRSPTRIRPDGIGGSMRIVQSREVSCGKRLDPGERSWRRSGPGSPAKRIAVNGGARPAVERVPSMRRTDLSPGRVKRNPNDCTKRTKGGDLKQRQSRGRESLESPLVSLECFIFL